MGGAPLAPRRTSSPGARVVAGTCASIIGHIGNSHPAITRPSSAFQHSHNCLSNNWGSIVDNLLADRSRRLFVGESACAARIFRAVTAKDCLKKARRRRLRNKVVARAHGVWPEIQ